MMLGEMLRIDSQEAAPLASAIGARTNGNPYDTVELVNALRRDGALIPSPDGWHWEAESVRRYLGHGDVVDLLTRRMRRLPASTQTILKTMACLGGEVETDLLCDANGLPAEEVEDQLLPALEDGLLIADGSGGATRFCHDRVQQAAFARLTPSARIQLRMELGRRLAKIPHRQVYAAEQYLPIVDAVEDPTERHQLIDLFRLGAAQARRVADYAKVERFVTAATALLATEAPIAVDPEIVIALAAERHQALYNLGRLAEADVAYQHLADLTIDPLALAEAAQVQISSLANQDRPHEAVDLGLRLLCQLGLPPPDDPATLASEIDQALDALYQWITESNVDDDLHRPECDDPWVLAVAGILNRIFQPAYFFGHPVMPWAILMVARLWVRYGPAQALVGPLCNASFITVALREDYRTGHAVVRRILAVSEARGYEPDTSHVRSAYALSSACWFEPLEDVIRQAHVAHEGLVKGGEPHFACHTYYGSLPSLLDSAATLDEVAAEAEAVLTFAARTGNDQSTGAFILYRQFIRSMRGETYQPGSLSDSSFDEVEHLAGLTGNQPAAAYLHVLRALAAAIFNDSHALIEHAACVPPLIPFIDSSYITASAHLVRALALTSQARAAPPTDAGPLLDAFDVERDWMAARVADAPGTFTHLLYWLEAEGAWTRNDFRAAAGAFDAALRNLTQRRRPWHRALITERSALFHLDNGMEHGGQALLAEARAAYEAWGAAAKVAALDLDHPGLRPVRSGPRSDATSRHSIESGRSGAYSAEEIDLLGVLNASQALSSETSLDRLRARVTTILSAMTGATSVRIVLLDETRGWLLLLDDDEPVPIDAPASRTMVPLSAFRYAERTHEPLVVDDAATDERFGRDPYFAGVACCSLVVVPILARGAAKAMLVLENRLSRTAFAADRLDGVMLIAGQLAVSLDNALLYASLERKVAERTQALGIANRRLETLSVTDALTGLANRRRMTDVLDQEWMLAVRHQTPLGLAMVDIDFFKLFNDHYGHPAGDQCLRQVAAILNNNVRATDVVARYGGEEFVIVMPKVNLEGTKRIAQRVRTAVAALDRRHEHSPLGFVTVSIGVASIIPSDASSPELLLEAADNMLYQAKRNGRNRVESAEPDR